MQQGFEKVQTMHLRRVCLLVDFPLTFRCCPSSKELAVYGVPLLLLCSQNHHEVGEAEMC